MTRFLRPRADQEGTSRRTAGGIRALLDLVVCLYLAVMIFRTFEVEGYIISTGSMAPTLLGFHKQVVCPSCGFPFAFGVSVDPANSGDTAHSAFAWQTTELRDLSPRGDVCCPNCGRDAIDVGDLPVNHGDQLLVLKHVFEYRPARRWEVVVLKSPARPTPPFVKRVVGLPGESIQIRDGDIYANGRICRKSLAQQRGMRILAFDNDYLPNDLAEDRGGFRAEPAALPWRPDGHGFAIAQAGSARTQTDAPTAWLSFGRWIRRGGGQPATVTANISADSLRIPGGSISRVRFDSEKKRLTCVGALSAAERDRLLEANEDRNVRAAIQRLYWLSHRVPVSDDYGYNRANIGLLSLPVRDVMLQCDVTPAAASGELVFEIDDGEQSYRLTLDLAKHDASLTGAERSQTLRSATFPAIEVHKSRRVELSIFDRQIVAAIDGTELFSPWECKSAGGRPPRTPIRIGARRAAVTLSGLKVFRDVYYTRGLGANGVDRPFRLKEDEYFVLGDNSPISNDGRNWLRGAVPVSQLVGKPFIVHLPSRPWPVSLFGRTRYIRIPDFRRIRYIR